MIPSVNDTKLQLDTTNLTKATTSPIETKEENSIFEENSTESGSLEENLATLNQEFETTKKEQGIFGNLWNGFKNLTGLGLSSNDVQDKIEDYKNGKITFEEAFNTIESYQSKQSGMIDLAANVISGVVTGTITVVSGGALTFAGVAAGAAIGGGLKAGIKTLDRATNEIENDALDLKQITKDTITGAVDGAINVATAGIVKGAAAGNTIKQAAVQGFKTGAISGSISGAASGVASYGADVLTEEDKEFDAGELLKTTAQNAIMGGLMGGVMGGVTQGVSQKGINSKANVLPENANASAVDDFSEESAMPIKKDYVEADIDTTTNSIKTPDYQTSGVDDFSEEIAEASDSILYKADTSDDFIVGYSEETAALYDNDYIKAYDKEYAAFYEEGFSEPKVNSEVPANEKLKISRNKKLDEIADPTKQTNEYIDNYNYKNPKKQLTGETLAAKSQDLEDLSPKAQELAEVFDTQVEPTAQHVNEAFADKTDIEAITARPKSQQSTFSKLAKKDIKGDLKSLDFDTCYDTVKDAVGVRIQMKSLTTEDTKEIVENLFRENNINATMDDFVKFLQDPNSLDSSTIQAMTDMESTILNALKTKQTESTVKQLIEGVRNGSIDISELSNYGDDISSYFTVEQIHDISEAYVEHAKAIGSDRVFEFTNNQKVPYNNEDGICNYKDLKNPSLVRQSNKSAIKESGYATSQMDATCKMPDGTTAHYELQIRGTEVNAFGDVEHIPYDIRTGKIFVSDSRYSDIYSLIEKLTDQDFNSYNQYLAATYKTLRMRELGILPKDCALPELSSYLKNISQDTLNKLDWNGLKEVVLKASSAATK